MRNKGTKIGETKSGKAIVANSHAYSVDFSTWDHSDAAAKHQALSNKAHRINNETHMFHKIQAAYHRCKAFGTNGNNTYGEFKVLDFLALPV